MMAGKLECIITPHDTAARVPVGVGYCADNGVYGKGWPGEARWFEWVRSLPVDRCRFVVAPDVVADAAATRERSVPWLDRIRAEGLPVAYAAQDGEHPASVPWSGIDVLFLGGSTAWKLGDDARALAFAAVGRGVLVHMGRVNSARRLRYAKTIGCASADGTFLAFGPDKNLPRLERWLHDVAQPTLF